MKWLRQASVRWLGTHIAHGYPVTRDTITSISLCEREELMEGLRVTVDSRYPRCPRCLFEADQR